MRSSGLSDLPAAEPAIRTNPPRRPPPASCRHRTSRRGYLPDPFASPRCFMNFAPL
jgi:hypothetical protein